MTIIPWPEDQPTLDIPTAGQACGLGRARSYESAKRGEIPTIRFGARIVVPTAALRRMLGMAEQKPETVPDLNPEREATRVSTPESPQHHVLGGTDDLHLISGGRHG